MPRKAKAVLCREHNKPVVVEEISIDAPKRGEVTVKLGACGVCHSDLSAINGTIALPLPLVLGHEGAGVVEEVGDGVTELAPGDHVVFSFIYMCGKCRFCVAGRPVLCLEQGKALTTPLEGTPRARDAKGAPLGIFSGCGAMAEYATVSAENLIKIDPKIPLDCAALVGCGVTTGVGAVFNTAKVEPGASVAVFGCGGVGLSVIQGALIAGARRIIAIDTLAPKLEMAKKFGATETVLATKDEDAVKNPKETHRRRPGLCLRMRRLGRARRHRVPRDPARRTGGGGRRGQAERFDRDPHHDASVRGEDHHRQLFRLLRAARGFSRACSRSTWRAGSSSRS